MSTTLDLGPAARQLKTLLSGTVDDQLSAPTPCESTSVGDLLDHLMGLTIAFRNAATKSTRPPDGPAPARGPGKSSAANLSPDWRSELPRQLDELVAAWTDRSAWEGTTEVGGMTMPASVAGLVALDELVLHGWDLARGTGQAFECDPASTAACFEFTTMAAAPGAAREGLFGPVVGVPPEAPLFDRALGLSGRDPAWKERTGQPRPARA
jgi:uncharacterized protein (TIGR03086 family)